MTDRVPREELIGEVLSPPPERAAPSRNDEYVANPDAARSGRPPLPQALSPDDRSWQDYSDCQYADPDLFFPERGASTREAKEICRGCVVLDICLEYALVNGENLAYGAV